MKKLYARKILVKYFMPTCLALLSLSLPVQAADYFYDLANTDTLPHYLDESIWTAIGAPATGDSVYLTVNSPDSPAIYYRYDGIVPHFSTLSVDNTGGGTMALSSSASVTYPLLSTATINIGNDGKGIFNLHSGHHSITDSVFLGLNSDGDGTYTMTGGSLAATDAGFNLYAGYNGIGTFTQSGGTVDLGTGYLYIGNNVTSSGSYALSGTSSLTAEVERIGSSGTGTFTQSGGEHKVATSLTLGYISIGDGTYTMTNGNLVATDDSFNLYAGHTGIGSFDQSGGTVNLGTGVLYAGFNSFAVGSYALSGASSSLTAYYGYIGHLGTGTFTQNDGEHVVGVLYLGSGSSGDGTYTMTGGSLAAADAGFNLYAGYNGIGSFDQSGGTVDLGTGDLYIGYNGTASGSYTLSGPGSLTTYNERIGLAGTGTFIQSGGEHRVTQDLYLKSASSADDTYTMTGGSLGATDAGFDLYAGYGGEGSFDHSAGTVDLGTGTLFVADSTDSIGSYALSGSGYLTTEYSSIGSSGTGSFTQSGGEHRVTSKLYVSGFGDGTYTMTAGSLGATDAGFDLYTGYTGTGFFDQSGGTVDLGTGTLNVGSLSGSSGSYTLSGTGLLTVENEIIGSSSTGSFTQNGGEHKVANYLRLGSNSTGDGTYTMTGGSLRATDDGFDLYVGYNGTGSFNLSDGIVDLGTGNLSIGRDSSSATGNYILSGTGSLTAFNENIGNAGTGIFAQSGGENRIISNLSIGGGYLGVGTYTMTGGSLEATDDDFNLNIGMYGTGSFDQTAGTADLGTGNLYVGRNSTAEGTYDLSGVGTLTADWESIGASGTGTFIQSGGENRVTSQLDLGNSSTGDGTYTMTGGSLGATDAGFNLFAGLSGSGSFDQTAGTVDLGTGVLYVGRNSTAEGSYDLSGTGSLHATNEEITSWGTSSFHQSGGSNSVSDTLTNGGGYSLSDGILSAPTIDNYGSFAQSGGTLTAGSTLHNQGNFDYSGGDFDGHLHLYEEGSFSYGTEFTAGNGITNDDFLTIDSWRSVNVHGLGLVNNNQISLYGILGGSGPLVNNGRMYAEGTIAGSGGFVNNGIFDQADDLVLSNSGLIENHMFYTMGHEYYLSLSGGNFENNGVMTMDSSVITGSASLINKEGGTLKGDGFITSAFSNEGRLLVTGNTGVSSAFISNGIVELAGAFANLSGGSIDNQGTVHGLGQAANTLSNSGMVEALNGTLTLSGSVTNNSGGQMSAASGSKLMVSQGLADNQGRITLQGGTFDNNSQLMTNSNQITGYGTVRSGGLTNAANMLLTGGSSTVDGTVTNSTAGIIEVAHGHATFNDDVFNDGLFKTTDASVAFAAGFTNNGTYFSDPSTQTFTDLTVGAGGVLIGVDEGDIFRVSGNFFNNSTRNEDWNTAMAWLEFTNGANGDNHEMSLASADFGADLSGYHDNFAWGRLDLGGGSLNLFDANSVAGGAFYVGSMLGLEIDCENKLISNIIGIDDLNLYYLADLDENAYLGGLDFDLSGGGHLYAVYDDATPTPVPGAVWLLGSGLAGLAAYRRRQRQ